MIKRMYWIETVPVEFVESAARLGNQAEGG
jgi:hypothetical protein